MSEKCYTSEHYFTNIHVRQLLEISNNELLFLIFIGYHNDNDSFPMCNAKTKTISNEN